MAGFVFERDLKHQNAAVSGVLRALSDVTVESSTNGTVNPRLAFEGMSQELQKNLLALKKEGDWAQDFKIDTSDLSQLIFDTSMETGTGKTYAYTKTMLELNKQTGVTKFIVAVPRVAIKAGTVSFLKSPAAKEHFREQFDRDINVYEVKSQKAHKGKKEHMPQAISDFCRADSHMNKKAIHILVINSGMINSKTMDKAFDVALFDEFNVPHEAIANARPILVIDEPHTFKRGNTTFKKLIRFKPQFTLRYGATFDDDLINMVYELSAVDAFNQDLVKGITVHLENFEGGDNVALRFMDSDGTEASFELNIEGKKTRKKITKGGSFEAIHPEMTNLNLDKLNKSTAVLSNGLILKKGDRINPYSYAETLQEKMVRQTIVTHFETERKLMLSSPRIKPLSLFFIDNIEGYRDKDGALKVMFEGLLTAHLKELISKERNADYREHLEAALKDVSALHGGYFSKDNSDSDEKIEQETIEILHDKETLLDIKNPRRFVFSKWTLREGWDNPNVFAICKLRSSGSETSKLQEVGRGLRLPVNEFMGRDRSAAHDLHYFVDFTEKKFAEKLTDEINSKSGVEFNDVTLTDALKARLLKDYPALGDESSLMNTLGQMGVIDFSQSFTDGGFDKLKAAYPKAFSGGLKKGKVKKAGSHKKMATIRKGKYKELKELWEAISQKVALEYKVKDEAQFKGLFKDYMDSIKGKFVAEGSVTTIQKLVINDDFASFETQQSLSADVLPFVMMSYSSFLNQVSTALALKLSTVHSVFIELGKAGFKIEHYMSQATIRTLKSGFNHYLMEHAFGKFEVGFKKTSNSIHPTKFTDDKGQVVGEVAATDIGLLHKDGKPRAEYFLDDIFYDGALELENIEGPIVSEVVVYSKIPKSSIRIPLVGGGTYSPDFAYVVKTSDGKSKLNLIVETKGKDEIDLGAAEAKRIKHAEKYFNSDSSATKVVFRRQLKTDKMIDIIKAAI